MALKSIVVQLTTDDQEIRGSFRALVTSAGTDILILGDKKSSIFFKLGKITIKSVTIRHTGKEHTCNVPPKNKTFSYNMVAGEKILIETFKPENKKQVYSILIVLYTKYKNKKSVIDTETFCVTEQYAINDIRHLKEVAKSKACHPDYASFNHVATRGTNINTDRVAVCKKDMEPKLQGNTGIIAFLNEISEGREYERKQDYWKQGYSGQLINSG